VTPSVCLKYDLSVTGILEMTWPCNIFFVFYFPENNNVIVLTSMTIEVFLSKANIMQGSNLNDAVPAQLYLLYDHIPESDISASYSVIIIIRFYHKTTF
jgi:hypothetical protein